MTKLNKNTKRAQNFMNEYKYAYQNNICRLGQCYNDWSDAKQEAYDYCKRRELELEGCHGCIISYNIFSFTYAFLSVHDNGTTTLVVITKDNEYQID